MSAAQVFVDHGLAFAVAVACGLPAVALALSPRRLLRLARELERRGARGWGTGPAAIQLYALVVALGSFAWAAWAILLEGVALALGGAASMVLVVAWFVGHRQAEERWAELIGWGVVLLGLAVEGAVLLGLGG
jgi:hypothetical protein